MLKMIELLNGPTSIKLSEKQRHDTSNKLVRLQNLIIVFRF